jgi:hypothetical protein
LEQSRAFELESRSCLKGKKEGRAALVSLAACYVERVEKMSATSIVVYQLEQGRLDGCVCRHGDG